MKVTEKGRKVIEGNIFRANLLNGAITDHFIFGKSWEAVEKSLYFQVIAAMVEYKQGPNDDPNVFVEEHADTIDPLVRNTLEGAKVAGKAAFGND